MAEETTDQQRLEAKKAAAPVERRAAVNFFIMLGHPEEYANDETRDNWTKLMREVMGHLETEDLESIKSFLHWALEINDYSAKYLREARDPGVTLVKNMESLKKRYKAYVKAQEIISRKKSKPKDTNLPSYREGSGDRQILKGDV